MSKRGKKLLNMVHKTCACFELISPFSDNCCGKKIKFATVVVIFLASDYLLSTPTDLGK